MSDVRAMLMSSTALQVSLAGLCAVGLHTWRREFFAEIEAEWVGGNRVRWIGYMRNRCIHCGEWA